MQSNLRLDQETLFLHANRFSKLLARRAYRFTYGFHQCDEEWSRLGYGGMVCSFTRCSFSSVVPPGQIIGELEKSHRSRWGLGHSVKIVSGSTDSNAGFYASGAGLPGEWSTTIGTTLAIMEFLRQKYMTLMVVFIVIDIPMVIGCQVAIQRGGGEILRDHVDSIRSMALMKDCQTVPKSLVYPSIRKGEPALSFLPI